MHDSSPIKIINCAEDYALKIHTCTHTFNSRAVRVEKARRVTRYYYYYYYLVASVSAISYYEISLRLGRYVYRTGTKLDGWPRK